MTLRCADPIQLSPSPFNSSPQCKKAIYVIISGKVPGPGILGQPNFWCASKKSFFSQCQQVPGHVLGHRGPLRSTPNTSKMPKNGIIYLDQKLKIKNWDQSDQKTSTFHVATVTEIWPFEVEIPVQAIFPLYL